MSQQVRGLQATQFIGSKSEQEEQSKEQRIKRTMAMVRRIVVSKVLTVGNSLGSRINQVASLQKEHFKGERYCCLLED
jgi:hypothetical protein